MKFSSRFVRVNFGAQPCTGESVYKNYFRVMGLLTVSPPRAGSFTFKNANSHSYLFWLSYLENLENLKKKIEKKFHQLAKSKQTNANPSSNNRCMFLRRFNIRSQVYKKQLRLVEGRGCCWKSRFCRGKKYQQLFSHVCG